MSCVMYTLIRCPSRMRRKPLPEDLPREIITHMPEYECCPDCGGQRRQFGEDVSEQLERIPATYKVIRNVRPKFACAVVIALSRRLLRRGRSSVAWLVSKFTSLSIGSLRSSLGKISILTVRHWLDVGSGK